MMSHAQKGALLRRQHDRLRALIAAVRDAAAAVSASNDESMATSARALSAAISAFGSELGAHLAAEEDLLGPILERIDAWGPVRLDLMRCEHAHQRAVLQALSAGDRLVPHQLAHRACELTADVLADMAAEERDLLSQSVLRDDVVVLDQSDC